MAELILSYKRVRVGEADVSSGTLTYPELIDAKFENLSWVQMLSMLARTIMALYEKGIIPDVVFQRTDREGLAPFTLDEKTVELFRVDPVTAIRSMTYVQMQREAQAEVLKPLTDIVKQERQRVATVGHTTLADSFGEVVYIRRGGDEVECPLCGDWAQVVHDKGSYRSDCFNCGSPRSLPLHNVSDQWAGVKVTDLLEDGAVDLFLPRAWNERGLWISRGHLEKKYENYLKEKSDV